MTGTDEASKREGPTLQRVPRMFAVHVALSP